jgi:hypothetical protein
VIQHTSFLDFRRYRLVEHESHPPPRWGLARVRLILLGDFQTMTKRTLVFLSLSLLLAIATLAQNSWFSQATQSVAPQQQGAMHKACLHR